MILKKLKVAAAVATMIASVGGVHAASVSQSGGTVAMETIKPAAQTAVLAQGQRTRVRAPAITYSYTQGPDAQSNGSQSFQIVYTLGGGAKWDFTGEAHDEVPGMLPNPAQVAAMTPNNPTGVVQTISAALRGAVPASRINVTDIEPPPGSNRFAIVLRSIDKGNTLPGSDLTVHPNDSTSVTYRFELVNRTAAPISLSELDITFNTPKVAGVITDYFTCETGAPNCRQAVDVATDENTAEYAGLYNLATDVVPTVGPVSSAANLINGVQCGADPLIRFPVRGNSGINNFQGTEPFTNVPATNVPVYNPSYVVIRRAIQIAVSPGANRTIATTNSFAENFSAFGLLGVNLTPTNGIGGSGGGRYTFTPTVKAVLPIQFGPGLNPTVTTTGTATLGSASSGDERDAALGVVSFRNIFLGASDRRMSADFYRFKLPGPTAIDYNEFETPVNPNNNGGIDLASLVALRLTVTQVGPIVGPLRLVWLGYAPGATCASSAGVGVTFTSTPGTVNWDFSQAQLLAAADPNNNNPTLAGKDLSICYNVPGNVTIPAASFTNVQATLFRDDISEQPTLSCPSTLAQLYGGVKVDVRNFNLQMVTQPAAGWTGILRVVNNSEVDTAQVDAQYIWNNGTYGNYGTIVPSLAPRGAVYVNAAQVVAALTKPASTLPLNATNAGTVSPSRYDDVPTAALLTARDPVGVGAGSVNAGSIRLRVSADVSTLRVQNYLFNATTQALTEVSSSQGADFVNIESSNRDHIDQDAQTDIKK